MRVISGKLKGRKIIGYTLDGTRPTMDRIKESLFGMIQDDIKNSICLDLFAGSGNLGIEALSNGAKFCYFVDNNREAIKIINENISNLDIKNISFASLSDWKKFLNLCQKRNLTFDIIFLDPPYDYDVYEKILNKVSDFNLLNKNGLIILEHHSLKLKEKYQNIMIYKEKKFKDKVISIYKRFDN